MKFTTGQLVEVIHSRKGSFTAIVDEYFDTENTEFYPLSLAEESVEGLSMVWIKGEQIPCRKSLCSIKKVTP